MSNMTQIKKSSGFTLIEFILVLVITGIIMGLGGLLLAEGFSTSYTGIDILKADQQARVALQRMTREMRLVRNKNSINISVPGQVTFTTPQGETITYAKSGSTLLRNGVPLADDVSSLTLNYFTANQTLITNLSLSNQVRFIQILLTIDNDSATYSFNTAVNLRNVR